MERIQAKHKAITIEKKSPQKHHGCEESTYKHERDTTKGNHEGEAATIKATVRKKSLSQYQS